MPSNDIPTCREWRDLCLAWRLPLELAAFVMDYGPGDVDMQVVYLVSSVIQAPVATCRRILRMNGISCEGWKLQE